MQRDNVNQLAGLPWLDILQWWQGQQQAAAEAARQDAISKQEQAAAANAAAEADRQKALAQAEAQQQSFRDAVAAYSSKWEARQKAALQGSKLFGVNVDLTPVAIVAGLGIAAYFWLRK